MALFLTEAEVERFATMTMALEVVEQAFRLHGEGRADVAPRRRGRLDSGFLHVMSASLPTLGRAGLKSYSTVAGKARFLVLLYADDGALLAVLEADKLGQLRTGAATGVATRYMARANASRVGIFGTGWQARSQIEAICAVRPIRTVVAFGRDPERRAAFCAEMTERLGVGVYPAGTPEEAARDMDIVVTATSAREPVLRGEWLASGAHVNAVGANWLSRQEIDSDVVSRSACVIVDALEQARLEAGDLEAAARAGAFFWEDARELGEVVTGEFPGREDDAEITLFESQGIALLDVALAARLYPVALEAGAGVPLPF